MKDYANLTPEEESALAEGWQCDQAPYLWLEGEFSLSVDRFGVLVIQTDESDIAILRDHADRLARVLMFYKSTGRLPQRLEPQPPKSDD